MQNVFPSRLNKAEKHEKSRELAFLHFNAIEWSYQDDLSKVENKILFHLSKLFTSFSQSRTCELRIYFARSKASTLHFDYAVQIYREACVRDKLS